MKAKSFIMMLIAVGLLAGCSNYEPEENFEIEGLGPDAEITKYKGNSWEVNIPPKINGRKIIRIDSQAFRYCSGLVKVTIPDTVTEIGDEAFEGCEYLSEVEIPKSVTVIGYWAFEDCKNLTNIEIPDGVREIKGRAFYGSGLTEVKIPKSVKEIDCEAFSECINLKKALVPQSTVLDEWSVYSVFPESSNLRPPSSFVSKRYAETTPGYFIGRYVKKSLICLDANSVISAPVLLST
jgi:hypothetical protein